MKPINLLALSGVVVLGIGLFFWRNAGELSVSLTPNPAPQGGFTIVKGGAGGNRLLLAATQPKELEPPVAVRSGGEDVLAGAAGGSACYIGPEKVNGKPETAQYKKGHPLAVNPGFAAYEFSVPADDDYALWLRAYWVNDCGNSVSVSLDGSAPRTLSGSTYGRWGWNLFRTGDGEPARIHLTKGQTHRLTICNREDDLYFDQILLLGTDRTWPDPTGIEN